MYRSATEEIEFWQFLFMQPFIPGESPHEGNTVFARDPLCEGLGLLLWHAARSGDINQLQGLLNYAYSPDDTVLFIALHHVVSAGHAPCVPLLLNAGVHMNAVRRWCLLRVAVSAGHPECMRVLLDTWPRDAIGLFGDNLLHEAVGSGNIACVRMLLNKGGTANARNIRGLPVLHRAARAGHTECAQLLLERGATVDARAVQDCTALHEAAYGGHTACVQLLLRKGAAVDSRDVHGLTALHKAASRGHTACMELLLEHGATVDARAIQDCTALHEAAYGGHTTCVQLLLSKGAAVDSRDAQGFTALHQAANRGHTECVQLLLREGAEIDSGGAWDLTPLHYAVESEAIAASMALMNAGAEIDAVDAFGRTALLIAVYMQHHSVIKILLEYGANPSISAASGETPLGVAQSKGYTAISTALLQPSRLQVLQNSAADHAQLLEIIASGQVGRLHTIAADPLCTALRTIRHPALVQALQHGPRALRIVAKNMGYTLQEAWDIVVSPRFFNPYEDTARAQVRFVQEVFLPSVHGLMDHLAVEDWKKLGGPYRVGPTVGTPQGFTPRIVLGDAVLQDPDVARLWAQWQLRWPAGSPLVAYVQNRLTSHGVACGAQSLTFYQDSLLEDPAVEAAFSTWFGKCPEIPLIQSMMWLECGAGYLALELHQRYPILWSSLGAEARWGLVLQALQCPVGSYDDAYDMLDLWMEREGLNLRNAFERLTQDTRDPTGLWRGLNRAWRLARAREDHALAQEIYEAMCGRSRTYAEAAQMAVPVLGYQYAVQNSLEDRVEIPELIMACSIVMAISSGLAGIFGFAFLGLTPVVIGFGGLSLIALAIAGVVLCFEEQDIVVKQIDGRAVPAPIPTQTTAGRVVPEQKTVCTEDTPTSVIYRKNVLNLIGKTDQIVIAPVLSSDLPSSHHQSGRCI